MYQRCYCDWLDHGDVNATAKPFGIVAAAAADGGRPMNRIKWHRCKADFFFIDPTSAQADPAGCLQNINSFRQKMSGEKLKYDIDLEFAHLNCSVKK
jgi:hypothetical protein